MCVVVILWNIVVSTYFHLHGLWNRKLSGPYYSQRYCYVLICLKRKQSLGIKKTLGPTHITLKFTQFWPDIQAENRKENPNNGEHGLQWYKSSSVKLPGKEKKYRNGESLLYYCIKRGIFLPFLTVLRVFKIPFFLSLNGLSPFVSFFRLYKCALLSIHSLSLSYTVISLFIIHSQYSGDCTSVRTAVCVHSFTMI